MSKKLTEEKIEEMIEELLQEKMPVNISNINNAKKELGTFVPTKNDLETIAKLDKTGDPNGEIISIEDFIKAYTDDPDLSKNKKGSKAVKIVRDNTSDNEVKNQISQAKIQSVEKKPGFQTTTVGAAQKQVTSGTGKSSRLADYVAYTRANKGASNEAAINKILEDNAALGAGLSVPDINLNQLTGKKTNPDGFLKLAASKLGNAGDVEEAVKKICDFVNSVASGEFQFSASTDKDKITELLSRMTLVQGFLSATRGFENSPMGFLMEGFYALLIDGQVMGGNQDGEDFVYVDSGKKKVTLYSSKFKVDMKIDIGQKTSKNVLGIMGGGPTTAMTRGQAKGISKATQKKATAAKYGTGIEGTGEFVYIFGQKDTAEDPKKITFYTATYDFEAVKKAAGKGKDAGQFDAGKLKAFASIDITDANIESMYKNFSALAESLAVDLNAVYKSMNNFKVLVNTYFLSWNQVAAEGAVNEFASMKKSINTGFAKGGAGTQLAESKLQTLDQLIAEAMRDSERKTKK